jgi:hypothetical protein
MIERRSIVHAMIAAFFMLAAIGCSSSKEAGEEDGSGRRPVTRTAESPRFVELDLVPSDGSVRTIQLYRTGNEAALPVIELGSGQTITLEFDLLVEDGRPLSVYFYHADRVWRRDLSPSEYLGSFHRDDLLDYRPSLGTEVPYVHYAYRFPSRSIEFLVSGNYIIRVTEQGDEEAVIFERAFFVTEQAASLDFTTDRLLLSGSGHPFTQPLAAFTPPAEIAGNVFDFNVCFVRNGRLDLARCAERPTLVQQPMLQFYLPPELSFEPEAASYFLDLGHLRVGNQIARTDFSVRPYRVELEPDYGRFGGSGISPLLNGQPVVSGAVVGVSDADVAAQYASVRFRYVPPDERPLSGGVIVTGSFNGWMIDPDHALEWMPAEGRYEGELLLKQGQYEYRYVSRDRRLAHAQRGGMPRAENQYAAFVYYRDIRVNTDRLLAVREMVAQ